MRIRSAAIHRLGQVSGHLTEGRSGPKARAAFMVGLSVLAVPLAAQTDQSSRATDRPISAIDWLDNGGTLAALPQNAAPAVAPKPSLPSPSFDEAPVAETIVTPPVTTSPLTAPQTGAVGLLPRSVTGLPATLWEPSLAAPLIRRIDRLEATALPAIQSLFYTLLLTEAAPPTQDSTGLDFLLARIDKLIEMGAVDPALALTDRAGPETSPALFSRWFDLSLLAGEEHRACQAMRAQPSLAPSDAALTFCRAAQGQYALAALTFGNAAVLGLLPPAQESLLRLYLDPDLAEETPPLPPPAQMTPLTFRLSEAIGQPLPTAGLPRAYAMTDLRGTSGWRAEIEAAERLTQSGALAENRLLGIYTDREPAASGGPWDRVEAVQALDRAITNGDLQAVSDHLPRTWATLRQAQLEVPFARLWATPLVDLALSDSGQTRSTAAARIIFDMAMLSPEYETLAARLPAPDDRAKFLAALAAGEPRRAPAPNAIAAAIQRGFDPDSALPTGIRLDLAQGKLGEAILAAMALMTQAAEGATKDIAPALTALRTIGLEDTARRAALQLMLLERHL